MHWGSPVNLSDVTHRFLHFPFPGPTRPSESPTHGFRMLSALLVLLMDIVKMTQESTINTL